MAAVPLALLCTFGPASGAEKPSAGVKAPGVAGDTMKKPPPPPETVPTIDEARPAIRCVDCDDPFDTSTHKALLDGLVANPYVAEFRKGLYYQDILHQFESKAHFDNCDFQGAMDYIESLLGEAGTHVATAQASADKGNTSEAQRSARAAFLSIGQAVHGVQDFYAHTNYVEMQIPRVADVTNIEIVRPWRAEGRERIQQLIGEGLRSGFVFWGFPQRCPSGSTSHAALAKDSETTKSGRRLVPKFKNMSQYRVAVFLAREASLSFVQDAFARWPLLREFNGPLIAIDTLVDRRGL